MSSHILFLDDEENRGKINIDDLYEKNMQRDLKQLSIFNKILNRIHKRITVTAKNKRTDQHAWFQVPAYLFGESTYNQGDCIAYLVTQLVDNGFHVRYVHPNTLFISWGNWIPSYVRQEVKKKTGRIINEKGEELGNLDNTSSVNKDPNLGILNDPKNGPVVQEAKQYTSIDQYKPSGSMVYNPDMFNRIERKMQPKQET